MTEQGREALDEAFNKLNELKKRWNQRLTLDNLNLAERYLDAQLGIHVHLRHRVATEAGRDSVDFCAIFQRKRVSERCDTCGGGEQLPARETCCAGVGGEKVIQKVMQVNGGSDAVVYDTDGHQETVFILDVELVEPPERIVRSLVRLGSLDEVHRNLPYSLYHSNVAGFKIIGTLEDGESGLVRDAFAPGAGYLTNEQVEGRTEVVDTIPDDSAPPRRGLAGYAGLVDQISRIRLVIGDSFIRVVLSEPLVEGFEITEVMFGPFDLYPDPGEIGLVGHD